MTRRAKKKTVDEMWHQYRWLVAQYGAETRRGSFANAKSLLPQIDELKARIDRLDAELRSSSIWEAFND